MRKFLGLFSMVVLALGLNSLGCDSSSSSDEDVTITIDMNQPEDDVTTNNDIDTPEGDTKPQDDNSTCTPACDGKQCGLDGCGGTCGTCPNAWDSCVDGQCTCTPDCTGKECGDNGCGGTCGTCTTGTCNATTFTCEVCAPNCTGKECGSDGCGGTCGTCTGSDVCNDAGVCEGGGDTGGCAAIFDCMNACEPTDSACQQNCVNEAEVEDQMAFNAIISCLDTNGYWDCADGDEECMSTAFGKCETEYVACFHGTLSCAEVYACLNSCPTTPEETAQQCGSDCISSGSVEGQTAWNTLIDCLDTNGYFDCADGDETCLETAWNACQSAFDACVPPGTASCLDMYLCLSACSDDACGQACLMSGSNEGKTAWNNFIDCLTTNGYFDCADGDETCLETSWTACDALFKECAHGTTTCQDIFNCLNACAPTDSNCALECRLNGSVDAQNAFEDVVDCILEACPEDDSAECQNTALQGTCSSLYNACMGN